MPYLLLMTWILWGQVSLSPCTLGTCQATPDAVHPPAVVQQAFTTAAACQERRDVLTQTFLHIDEAMANAGGTIALAHYSRATHRFWCAPDAERPTEASAPRME